MTRTPSRTGTAYPSGAL